MTHKATQPLSRNAKEGTLSWLDYYELLQKYDGDLSRATKEEMAFAAKCNPNDPPRARAIAQTCYTTAFVRREPEEEQ